MALADPSDGSLPLGKAIAAYVSTLPVADRESNTRELGRFARWLGASVPIEQIRPADVGRYQEAQPESAIDINQRLEPLKAFLAYLRNQKLIKVNLGAHVRLRRATQRKSSGAPGSEDAQVVRMTSEGYAALAQELEHLEREVRPQVTEELSRAFADKDFRENAPYDAAKQKLGEVQGRINQIRSMLSAASIQTSTSNEVVDLGVTVTLRDIHENEDVTYTVVGPGEVSLRERKISAASPVGSALVNHRVGDVVEVNIPGGAVTYRIERIERLRAAAATKST